MDDGILQRTPRGERCLSSSTSSTMSSQRLEEIVARLMKPVNDMRQNFDTDLSMLLEEYLTAAGLHALDTGEAPSAPNFAELALLLQQSANIYSRKVDYLYQHVLDVSDSLTHTVMEPTVAEENVVQSSGRRKRKHSDSEGLADFRPIELEAAGSITREPELHRPPPTLPRTYIEFEPRAITERDVTLVDYRGDSIGFVTDFHVNWNLKDGFLVDDLDSCAAQDAGAVRPVPLAELHAMLAARAPSPPRNTFHSRPASPEGSRAASPLPPPALASDPAEEKTIRKRKQCEAPAVLTECSLLACARAFKRIRLKKEPFELPCGLIQSVLEPRTRKIIKFRRWLRKGLTHEKVALFDAELALERARADMSCARDHSHMRDMLRILAAPWDRDFHGFNIVHNLQDIGGFPGWSVVERAAAECTASSTSERLRGAVERAKRDLQHAHTHLTRHDSVDDGFFEQSSFGDSDSSLSLLSQVCETAGGGACAGSAEETSARVEAWHALVAPRVQAAERRGALDVRVAATRVVRGLQRAGGAGATTLSAVLGHVQQHDVSRLFLATLFLANTGNVHIERGVPLAVGDFTLRLVSADSSLYCDVDPFN